MDVLAGIYLAGAAIAAWRTDASWPMRIALAALWPLGPLAFLVTVTILLTASLIGFPLIAGPVAVAAGALAWWIWS